MAPDSSAGPALAPAQDKADSVSLTSAGPALAPAQDKADSMPGLTSSAGPALAPAQGKAESEALIVVTSIVGAPAAPAAPPATPAAPAAAPAAIVSASARDEGPAPKRLRHDGPAVPRGMPWGRVVDGRPRFVIARTHADGEFKAVIVTCNLHRADGQRCNKSLNLGAHFTEEEATR